MYVCMRFICDKMMMMMMMIIDDVFRAHLIFYPLKSHESEHEDVDGNYTALRGEGEPLNGRGNVYCLWGCMGMGLELDGLMYV